MLQLFNFIGRSNIAAQGVAFQYLKAENPTLDARIDVYANGSAIAVMEPGDDVQLPQDVTQWEIVPRDAAQRGQVAVGKGRLRRLSTRYVLEGAIDRTLLGLNYTAGHAHTSASGTFPLAVFEAGSLAVALRQVSVSADKPGPMIFWRVNGTLTTPLTTGQAAANKTSAGNAAACVWKAADLATYSLTPTASGLSGWQYLGHRRVAGHGVVFFPGAAPFFILQPGESLAVLFGGALTTIEVNSDFEVLSGVDGLSR